jgi:hypothetical protein
MKKDTAILSICHVKMVLYLHLLLLIKIKPKKENSLIIIKSVRNNINLHGIILFNI